MFCRNCGSQIDNNAAVCPHCGTATGVTPAYNYANNYAPPANTEDNYIAIVGFVLSFFIAIVGLICSIIGYKSAPQYGGKGKNLALAGIIISAIQIAITIGIIIFYLVIFGVIFSAV